MTTYMSRYSIASPPNEAAVSTPRPVPEPWRFRPDIEGLRAVAILLVVVGHTGAGVAAGGFVGIDVFFVISGFLLTGQLFRELERTGRISLRAYYARRATRLLPVATVTVLVTLAASWRWLPPGALRGIGWDSLASATGWMNVRLAAAGANHVSVGSGPEPLRHFWSIAVQEQFSLLWPLVMILAALVWLRRRPNVRALWLILGTLFLASLVAAAWLSYTDRPWAVFGLPTRLWELGAGALIGLSVRRLVLLNAGFAAFLSWTGLVAIGLAAVLMSDGTSAGWILLWPVLGAALVIVGGCADPPGGAARLLTKGPMQELGRLSYGWYLWHWPVLLLAPYVLGHPPSLLVKLALAVGALVLAFMSLVAVENRVRLSPAVQARPWQGLAIGSGLTAFAAAAATLTLFLPLPVVHTAPAMAAAKVVDTGTTDAAQLQRLVAAGSTATAVPAGLVPSLTAGPTDYPRDGNCLAPTTAKSIAYSIGRGCEGRGYVHGAKTVVLFGDSHAQHWFDALNVVAQQRKWRIVVFVKSNCGAALSNVAHSECDQWREEALVRMAQFHPAVVVMSALHRGLAPLGTDGTPDQAWAAGWLTTVQRIRAFGAAPVILQDSPYPKTNVVSCLKANPQAIGKCALKPAIALDLPQQRAIQKLGADNAFQVIDTTPWFCTASTCPVIVGGTIVYRDTNHLTATYSKLLGGVLSKELIQ